MEDLKKMNTGALVDMLAKYTSDYMRILKDGGTKAEYESCKMLIDRLTKEIAVRRKGVNGDN